MAQSDSVDRRKEKYPLPLASDAVETSRLDEQHDILKLQLGGLFPCPEVVIDVLRESESQVKSVLDLGSGSGVWCRDVVHQFPNAQVLGIDIAPNPLQPSTSNCKFEVWDINKGLFPFYGQFDLVHMRFIHGLVDHYASTLESIKCLKPGGLILFFKAGPNVTEDRVTLYPAASSRTPEGSWFQRFVYIMDLGSTLRGIRSELFIRDYDEGFWDYDSIDATTCGAAFITTPIGPWVITSDPAETAQLAKIGEFWKRNLGRIYKLLSHVAAASRRSPKDLEILYKRVEEELETTRVHSLLTIRAIWGRAYTVGHSSSQNESLSKNKNTSLFALSNDPGGFRVMTLFDNKPAWTKFTVDLTSTMTADTKGLKEVPNFDPIEE